jgi:hypothetical protein
MGYRKSIFSILKLFQNNGFGFVRFTNKKMELGVSIKSS